MNDQETTVGELRKLVDDFVAERDWHQFHSPKNISMALAIETSELMEHFQWITIDVSRAVAGEPNKLAEVAEELADVLSYTVAMANALGIDLAATIEKKMVKNAKKYPAEEFKGKFGIIEEETAGE